MPFTLLWKFTFKKRETLNSLRKVMLIYRKIVGHLGQTGQVRCNNLILNEMKMTQIMTHTPNIRKILGQILHPPSFDYP